MKFILFVFTPYSSHLISPQLLQDPPLPPLNFLSFFKKKLKPTKSNLCCLCPHCIVDLSVPHCQRKVTFPFLEAILPIPLTWGWKCMNLSPIPVTMVTSLILYKSCVDNHICCEVMNAAVPSWPVDIFAMTSSSVFLHNLPPWPLTLGGTGCIVHD